MSRHYSFSGPCTVCGNDVDAHDRNANHPFTAAPRCATCGHGYDWHVATGTMVHCRGCCGTGRECVHAFVPPADAKPAESIFPPAVFCSSCYNGEHKCDGEPCSCAYCRRAPRAQPAEAERCPDGLLPDGYDCPRCGGKRGPSGIGGGTWVHFPHDCSRRSRSETCERCGRPMPLPAKPPAPAALREAAERALMLAGFIVDGELGAGHRLRVTRSQMQDYARQIEGALRAALDRKEG